MGTTQRGGENAEPEQAEKQRRYAEKKRTCYWGTRRTESLHRRSGPAGRHTPRPFATVDRRCAFRASTEAERVLSCFSAAPSSLAGCAAERGLQLVERGGQPLGSVPALRLYAFCEPCHLPPVRSPEAAGSSVLRRKMFSARRRRASSWPSGVRTRNSSAVADTTSAAFHTSSGGHVRSQLASRLPTLHKYWHRQGRAPSHLTFHERVYEFSAISAPSVCDSDSENYQKPGGLRLPGWLRVTILPPRAAC